jgi:hypothetical protein
MASPTLKLDRSRTFATCHGENLTHAFEQDGLPFNFQGELVARLITPEQKALVDKKLKRLAKLAGKAPGDEPAAPGDAATSDEVSDADASTEMNFEQWLKDEVRYEPHAVFKEAKRRYSKNFSNYRDLAEFLVAEENICGPEDVPTKLKA